MRSCLPLLAALLAMLHTGLAQAAGTGSLNLRCTTAEAEVFIDGDSAGKTPLPKQPQLSVGEHTIRVSRPGFTPYIDVFRIKDGQTAKLDVELIPISGVLRLTSTTAGARVFVDDKYVGDAPVESEMNTGTHTVRVEGRGYHAQTLTVTAVAGKVVEQAITLIALPPDQNPYLRKAPPPPKWYQKWWVWTIGAVGVAAVATAIIVPVVLLNKDVCDGLDVCVQNVGSAQTTQGLRQRQPQFLSVSVAF